MLELLTEDEMEIMYLLVQGHNFNGISAYLCIDYPTYKHIKKSLLNKLHISRITEILTVLVQNKEVF